MWVVKVNILRLFAYGITIEHARNLGKTKIYAFILIFFKLNLIRVCLYH